MENPCTPPPFRLTVAGIVSEGDAGVVRTHNGFTLQVVHRPGGRAEMGGPMIAPSPPSSTSFDFAIEVLSSDFHDGSQSPEDPTPYEGSGAGDFFGVPGSDWGQGLGDGAATDADLATALAAYLQRVYPLVAVADTAEVFCKFRDLDVEMGVTLTNRIETLVSRVWNLTGPGPSNLRTQVGLRVRRAVPDRLPPTTF